MNKNLKDLLDEINAKKESVQNLVAEDKIEDAKTAKEELIALQNKFDLLKDIEEEEPVMENVTPVIEQTENKNAVSAFIAAARAGFPMQNAYSGASEGVDANGGYTVPEDIQTKINKYREAHFSLASLVDSETVSTDSGRRTFQKKTQHTGFTSVAEAGKIGAVATPQFEVLSYAVSKYAGYLPVTNELLADSDANIEQVLVNWLGEEDVATRNSLILTALKSKAAVAIKGLNDIKKAINVTLGQAYAGGVHIVTNDDGLNFLDTLTDTTGRYILSPDAQNPMQMILAVGAKKIPVDVVPNSIMPSDDTAGVPFFAGDLHEAIKVFDRAKMSVMQSNTASIGTLNAFEQDLTILRGIERLDTKVKDADAYVYMTLKTA